MSFRRDDSGGIGGGGPKHKREAAANRDALFGPPGGGSSGGGAVSRKPAANQRSRATPAAATAASSSTSSAAAAAPSSSSSSSSARPFSATSAGPSSTSQGCTYPSSSITTSGDNRSKASSILSTSVLSGTAKITKMAEAEDYRKQATKAMQSGLFTKPDPIAAATYYKRAADAYQQCGENRLERLHRIASADCSRGTGTFATAAAEYTRAAQLALASDEPPERKQQEGYKLYQDAAQAWREIGETAKVAKCLAQAALALLWERNATLLPKEALVAIEQAVEAHVPDVLNRYARYRQTGTSAFLAAGETIDNPSPQTMALAKDQIVTQAYAQEGLQDVMPVLIQFGEYASALYAAGAVSAILERDGISTLSLARSYVVETILTLALGDAVAAEQAFLQTHVQSSFYLSSRECQLAEELFRAILQRDREALDEARSPTGRNRAALANLPNESLRQLVTQLRISGVAKKVTADTGSTSTTTTKKIPKPTPPPKPQGTTTAADSNPSKPLPPPPPSSTTRTNPTSTTNAQAAATPQNDEMDADALQAEMDNLMNDLDILGDDDDDDDDGGVNDDDDDDIDLR